MKKLFRVSGVCMVPTICTMEIEAASELEAVKIAVTRKDWKSYIDQNGGDCGAAYDWQPFADEIEVHPRNP